MALSLIPCLLACFAAGGSDVAGRESLDRAILETRADIVKATESLCGLRDAQAGERKPLALRLEALQTEVKALRAEAERLRKRHQQEKRLQEDLADRARSLAEERRLVASLLSEYRRSVEARAGRAETTFFSGRLKDIDACLADSDSASSLPDAARRIFGLASEWNEAKLGGALFDGAALDGKGVETAGGFAVFGPLAYFSAADGSLSGLVVARLDTIMPSVYSDFDGRAREAIHGLVSGRESGVPVDVSAGDALKIRESGRSLIDQAREGGVVMIPLFAVAAWAFVLAVWELARIRRVEVPSPACVDPVLELLERGDVAGAQGAAGRLGAPLGPVVLEAIEHRSAPREQLEEIMHERILAFVPALDRRLGQLAVLGGVAPLLGLLGTVTGMIHTFRLVTVFGTGDAKLLSGGISEALVTTEFGLIIAIPVLLVHAYLARRVRKVVGDLENVVAGFVSRLTPGDQS